MTSTDETTRAAWAASLNTAPVLGLLAKTELLALIDSGAIERFADGDEIIRRGDRSDAVFLLVRGTCDVRRADTVVRLDAPALVGEIAALTGTPRTATVRAVGEADAVMIERDRFMAAIGRSAVAGQALTELVADRICAPDSIRQVGRFAVDGIVGKGGSGRVLRARHPLLEIPVALKMLSHALALLPDGPRAFVREAALLIHLDHPGIVRVLDAFEAHGTFFIVMPWIDGASLRSAIDAGSALTREQVVRVGDECLDALAALHAAGLVHRDVKPSNILVRSSGRVVLIDFGVACAANASAADRGFVGSPAYSSPEQILGRPVDGRSDVYSLGCTLYELVYGEPPFGQGEIEKVVQGHLHGTASFDREPRVAMGDGFTAWLKTCLSRTRARRPDAAHALSELRAL